MIFSPFLMFLDRAGTLSLTYYVAPNTGNKGCPGGCGYTFAAYWDDLSLVFEDVFPANLLIELLDHQEFWISSRAYSHNLTHERWWRWLNLLLTR